MNTLEKEFLTLKEASKWATEFLNKKITESNISYLINYGRINKYSKNGNILVSLKELKEYYERNILNKEQKIKEKLGKDISWDLSFDWLSEKERTKHVHRLHPYKGKFIPQLVEYFLSKFFKEGDIILDPFVGSGTTLIQANEMNIHSIGIDISEFNTIITEVKFSRVNISELQKVINNILKILKNYEKNNQIIEFEKEIKKYLEEFNKINFPSPEFKKKFREGKIDKDYLMAKQNEISDIYQNLIKKYNILLNQTNENSFLDKWYIPTVREEAQKILSIIQNIEDKNIKKSLMVILSRTMRSVRATTHMDLDRLKEPQYTPYFCYKHFKICKPVFSLIQVFKKYANDTIERIQEYQSIKTDAYQEVLTGDSRSIDIFEEIKKKNEDFYNLLKNKKITGIFTSPPYVGQIDYHEQHAYAYELFGIERKDELEIGPLYKGKDKEARESYIEGITQVLKNSLKYMVDNPIIIIVANDEYNLYPKIAENVGLKIIEEYKRPVLNRTSRDKNAYYESVFVMRKYK
ncbi:DNA methylase [Venenivibrio stagnispumantis]|uniref:site-specific DNA-methyltransferase (cytosine-N(4)-specific) n=1 Tax=Venenivibrio stagnispumantis TaxID=407998 RepID=A0AA45WPD4_9AQUI|nr:site-specific DNA-methyltransferase [Venenivibrio stagnispumantis]MCW4573384.1 site-specific DNA-methyltransferase [Venenivibrio stagnispumantis]SMP20760.1 DNA methylase [Venenivibrio stagnispumantis]